MFYKPYTHLTKMNFQQNQLFQERTAPYQEAFRKSVNPLRFTLSPRKIHSHSAPMVHFLLLYVHSQPPYGSFSAPIWFTLSPRMVHSRPSYGSLSASVRSLSAPVWFILSPHMVHSQPSYGSLSAPVRFTLSPRKVHSQPP